MKTISDAVFGVAFLAMELATGTFLVTDRSASSAGLYGTSSCPCVGIDNMKGYYATQQDAYHVQYSAEAGASCSTWEMGMHPECRGGYYDGPEWCRQSWCYVDPCNCHLDILPKETNAGVKFQGGLAYWSYATCGSVDHYSEDMNKDGCVSQKTEALCIANSDCAWNGEMCGGKDAMNSCKAKDTSDQLYGQEDCRCIGIDGRNPGKAFLYVNDEDVAEYSINVGARCEAWEHDAHPACLKDGAEKPEWCSMKWCFVDPCKCKTKMPPKAAAGPNKDMMFEGKVAHWSAATCGNVDTWSSSNESAMGVVDDHIEELCATPSGASAKPSMAFVSFLVVISAMWAR